MWKDGIYVRGGINVCADDSYQRKSVYHTFLDVEELCRFSEIYVCVNVVNLACYFYQVLLIFLICC